jgi:hypothetical protein
VSARDVNVRHKRQRPVAGASAQSSTTSRDHSIAIVIRKPSGVEICFSVFQYRAEADAACARLRSFGLAARVEERKPGVAPGTTIK